MKENQFQTVCVDVEGHFNLRHATRRRWDAGQLKLAENVVVLSHGTLAFVHLCAKGMFFEENERQNALKFA
jgi:hypothetical protein